MSRRLRDLNRRYQDGSLGSSLTDFWAQDPAGHIVQITTNPEGYWSRLEALVGALPAEEIEATHSEPVFRTVRIACLGLGATDLAASVDYYEKFLGERAHDLRTGQFRVGPAHLVLEPASTEFLCLAVSDFDLDAAAHELEEVGVHSEPLRERNVLEIRDPDGIRIRIGGV